MICPFCLSFNTLCVDSRQFPDQFISRKPNDKLHEIHRRRRYQCNNCNTRFSTEEFIQTDLRGETIKWK